MIICFLRAVHIFILAVSVKAKTGSAGEQPDRGIAGAELIANAEKGVVPTHVFYRRSSATRFSSPSSVRGLPAAANPAEGDQPQTATEEEQGGGLRRIHKIRGAADKPGCDLFEETDRGEPGGTAP
jgi:hypothetical protein